MYIVGNSYISGVPSFCVLLWSKHNYIMALKKNVVNFN